ncbi:MAG: hypothetical protein AB8B56_12320 [Crocinitomicaceae bacterium]
MKAIALTFTLSLFAIGLQAQTFEVPSDVKLEKQEDYSKYEGDIKKCYEWLMTVPPGEQQRKKDLANQFMIPWVLGSQNVSIEIKPSIVTFMETSPEMLSIFFGAWANYSLSNNYSQDRVKCSKAAINAVIKYYEDHSDKMKKDPNIEECILLKEKDKKERTTDFDKYIKDKA